MRLLNTQTLQLHEFYEPNIPPYAILSHTWLPEGEPTFQDMKFGLEGTLPSLPGYKKVEYAIRQAISDGLDWVWADTICIDKTNSTELFEAINSMFRWYKEADACYAYLVDVDEIKDIPTSRWFTRGWTLQELLAPDRVIFYGRGWHTLGGKGDLESGMRTALLKATGIPPEQGKALNSFDRDEWTIAEKMSWAANRVTTRREDIAYSLLGLFGVHMPLLYGEGEQAFTRLQEEIMRVSDDQSLFLWADSTIIPESPCGLLATSPAQFKLSSSHLKEITSWPYYHPKFDIDEPYSMTNKGITIPLTLVPLRGHPHTLYLAVITDHLRYNKKFAIIVRRLIRSEFTRVCADWVAIVRFERPSDPGPPQHRRETITDKQRHPIQVAQNTRRMPMFYIECSGFPGCTIADVFPPQKWSRVKPVIQPTGLDEMTFVRFAGPIINAPAYFEFNLQIKASGLCSLSGPFGPLEIQAFHVDVLVGARPSRRILQMTKSTLPRTSLRIVVISILENAHLFTEPDTEGAFITVQLSSWDTKHPYEHE